MAGLIYGWLFIFFNWKCSSSLLWLTSVLSAVSFIVQSCNLTGCCLLLCSFSALWGSRLSLPVLWRYLSGLSPLPVFWINYQVPSVCLFPRRRQSVPAVTPTAFSVAVENRTPKLLAALPSLARCLISVHLLNACWFKLGPLVAIWSYRQIYCFMQIWFQLISK